MDIKTLFPNYNRELLCKCGEELDEGEEICIICDLKEAHSRLEAMYKNAILAEKLKGE